MINVLGTNYNGTVKLIEETLSEAISQALSVGSKFYNVDVGPVSIICGDDVEALELFDRLSKFTIIDNQ